MDVVDRVALLDIEPPGDVNTLTGTAVSATGKTTVATPSEEIHDNILLCLATTGSRPTQKLTLQQNAGTIPGQAFLHTTTVTSGELSRNAIRVGGCQTSNHPTAGRPANNTLQLQNPDKAMGYSRDAFLCVETKNTPGNSFTTELNTRMKLRDNNTGLDTRGNTQILELNISVQESVEDPCMTSKLCAASKTEVTFDKTGGEQHSPVKAESKKQ